MGEGGGGWGEGASDSRHTTQQARTAGSHTDTHTNKCTHTYIPHTPHTETRHSLTRTRTNKRPIPHTVGRSAQWQRKGRTNQRAGGCGDGPSCGARWHRPGHSFPRSPPGTNTRSRGMDQTGRQEQWATGRRVGTRPSLIHHTTRVNVKELRLGFPDTQKVH